MRSDASIATSVPVPIAIPRSACASAGSVVDAVADHRHDLARGLQPSDSGSLLLRQHLGDHALDPDLARDAARRARRRRR